MLNVLFRAYDLYESNRLQPSSQTRKNTSQFKRDNCWKDLRVHFVGVWYVVFHSMWSMQIRTRVITRDTLSPIERRRGAVPPISSPMHACHFRHALALDEDRDRLHPEYLQGTILSNVKDSNDIDTCDIKEVWFEGDHFDLYGIIPLSDENFTDSFRSSLIPCKLM
ncbi:hypothetical protein J3R83DRAFT_12523 [Lanmaoa asiatica]|nr:hypothetical protein J3R83DRAFT_12523 [Lanmaoa asiatica]